MMRKVGNSILFPALLLGSTYKLTYKVSSKLSPLEDSSLASLNQER